MAVTPSANPLAAVPGKFVLAGKIESSETKAACNTVHVRATPPPSTTIVPVRTDVPSFAATSKITVPLVVPDPPDVIVSHETLVTAVQPILAVTPSANPLAAVPGKFVLAG